MPLLTSKPKGTSDILPGESEKIVFIEDRLRACAALYGFREIRTPVFEHTELFRRGVGETTDVVQKEMYTFEDNGHRSITLRPEGTAGTVRAFLEHGLFNEPLPQKYFYLTSCYRYEKPQAGRLREFHQFGVEALGTGAPAADAEIISLAKHIFDLFGIDGLRLELNSIGCPVCRKTFQTALRDYFSAYKDKLCDTCLTRLENNPMRILDCKSPVCGEIAKGAPKVLDYLCEECADHFSQVKKYLHAMDIDFIVNPTIVRGLDYYTKTVFEFVSDAIGAQGTVCGGGRYDGLIAELGGASMPACGFGMGIERLKLLLEAKETEFPPEKRVQLYLAPANPAYSFEAMRLCDLLRTDGVAAQTDTAGRSLKAQMKYANKLGAQFTLVLGEDEIHTHTANIKNMDTGEEKKISLDRLSDEFLKILLSAQVDQFPKTDDEKIKFTLLNGGKNEWNV